MIHKFSLVACLPATFLDILEACQAVTTSENLTEDVIRLLRFLWYTVSFSVKTRLPFQCPYMILIGIIDSVYLFSACEKHLNKYGKI